MFLMFALRRHNVLPTGDFGIRMAMKKAYGLEAGSAKAGRSMGKDRGLRGGRTASVACWYLWEEPGGKKPAASSQ